MNDGAIRPGPLAGVRIVELGAIGPVPHAMMILADMGADVVRVARPIGSASSGFADIQDDTLRGRRQVRVDLKSSEGVAAVLDLVRHADVVVEGFRPGVAERLGVGPDECRAVNDGVIFARMTGWGQEGPLARRAGHDLNYVSLTGALHAMGREGEKPPVPLNLVGDFGGGSMFLVAGILAALVERANGGEPRIVDVAMVDGVAALEQPLLSMGTSGTWSERRGTNLIDGGAPFYDTYECGDGAYVAVAAIEPQFFAVLVRELGMDPQWCGRQYDESSWPELREVLSVAFAGGSRDEWAARFAELDACVTPVLSFSEAPSHPHLAARGTLVRVTAGVRAAPAPRFGAGSAPIPGDCVDADVADVVATWEAENS